MKSKKYYALTDGDGNYYMFELQEDRLRMESWYQVSKTNEIGLAYLFPTYETAEADRIQIEACNEKVKLKIIDVNVEIGKYSKKGK